MAGRAQGRRAQQQLAGHAATASALELQVVTTQLHAFLWLLALPLRGNLAVQASPAPPAFLTNQLAWLQDPPPLHAESAPCWLPHPPRSLLQPPPSASSGACAPLHGSQMDAQTLDQDPWACRPDERLQNAKATRRLPAGPPVAPRSFCRSSPGMASRNEAC